MTYRQLLWGNADVRRLWMGQVVSDLGDWLNNIAVFALAIELAGEGREGLAVALYAVARHLPLFVFGPIAGVVVDRVERRRVMIVSDLARAVLALGFIAADRFQSLPIIYVVGAALFAVSSFFNAARRATLPNIVRDTDELLTANSLTASTFSANLAIGSALGGLVATFMGRNVVFILNSLTFVVSAEMIRRIRARTRRSEPETAGAEPGVWKAARRVAVDFSEGLRYVRSDSLLSIIFIVSAGWGLGNGVGRALYSLFGARLGEQAVTGLVQRPTDFGISMLFVAMGVGGLIGAPLARRFAQAGESMGARVGRSMTFDGLGLAVFAMMPNLWGAAAVLIAREVNFAIWWTAQQTVMMKRTDDRYAGRVFASYETLITLTMLGAMFVSGAVADTVGIRPVAACGGIAIISSGILWFVLLRRRHDSDEPAAASAEKYPS